MTVYINLEADQQYQTHRDHFWRSGYIDQSHFHFRDTREFLQKYQFSKQFDEVIYLSADDIELDQTKKAKLDFYLDKLAKSAAAKARNQNVAIVTNGTVGLSSRLPALAKTYTGSKGVQITTIGISPYDVTDAGNHNPQVIANGTDIRNAGNGFDLHVLVKFKEKLNPKEAWGSELHTMYQIIAGMVSRVGSITAIYAKSAVNALRELMVVVNATRDGIKINPTLVQGTGGLVDGMIAYFHDTNPGQINVNGETLEALETKLLNENHRLHHLKECREIFIQHSLNSALPDVLPTGVTLDKTGRPAWETVLDMKNFI